MRASGRHTRVTITTAIFAAATTLATGIPRGARADEPVPAKEVRLLRETGENTTVIDAFDKDDPFDANLILTFRQQWKNASIRRETSLAQPGLSTGGFVSANENVASYRQSVSILELGTDIGLYKDLAFSFRLPIILADSRELTPLDGSDRNPERLQDPAGNQLFTVPFKSPTRSGVDYLSIALNYAILNQQRDDTKPTWVVGVEGRFGVGTPLHACNARAPVQCPNPALPGQNRDAGISRGMTSIGVHTIFSRRYGYLEPYAGFRMMAEFPRSDTDLGDTSGLRGSLLNRPPLLGSFTVGTEIFPYENKEAFQRLGLDFRVRGTYHSPGREYSELFDALGSSQAKSLRDPNPGAYRASPADSFASVADPNSPKVFFTGVTDQQAYGSFGGAIGITWQAGEYVKFNAGFGLTYAQSHVITAADACNPDLKGDPGTSGPCRSGAVSAAGGSATGIPNPNHRQVIDLPGRRFTVDDTTIVDLWLSGVVMF